MGMPKSFQLAIRLFAIVALQITPFEGKAFSGDLPKYNHIVVVMMENHAFDQIFAPGSDAVYMRSLAKEGAVFSQSFGVTHPSQPNYLALFSGSTQGVCNDLNHDINAPNLATRLAANGKSFAGYIEDGSPRKHNPWESFTNLKGFEKPLNHFPTDYAQLPSVSFVIPNLQNDMHDGTIRKADAWLKKYLGHYAGWTRSHNSLLIVTFDEDDRHSENRIPTLLYGSGVRAGVHSQTIDHYSMLRTIEDIEHLAPIGMSAHRAPIRDAWHVPVLGQKRNPGSTSKSGFGADPTLGRTFLCRLDRLLL